ncbi:hypothetical protein [Flavobacterium hydatis]|uniref:Uncharacterized protein n=1 Tax=Flavobacterium hydatis TaxID=991 RepID=A0A086A386_FLAHY|nr:hypothetical protein [Flavobacterium hydatis]KFF11150.1 hypothetical protein IW20_19595 [Flavobacterium hydatis]OXA97808.1 hypothetical protein B0A62_02835 [Flavobacterium hydatis]
MQSTDSENIVSRINSSVFFKEFTFSKNDFKELDTNQQLEFADNVVWLDDLFFIFQIKERENGASSDEKWFESKIRNKAVKQIKSTLKYISKYPEIFIENEKGHKLDVTKAKANTSVKKIIIYSTNEDFPEELRNQKFYESTDVGLIHLFHSEDYYWICKYLITPTEINEYLNFREDLFLFDKIRSNALAEQYFLAHFLETPYADHFNAEYINNLKNENIKTEEFDVSFIINNFNKNIKLINHQTEYYPIIQEIAKLNRTELIEFKKRVIRSMEKTESIDLVTPYRIYSPRTDCGFVFIPAHSSRSQHWKNTLSNYTMAHKYDSKARKCIGLVVYKDKEQSDNFEFFWQFIEGKWVFDEELDILIAKDNPFRKIKTKMVNNRYKM